MTVGRSRRAASAVTIASLLAAGLVFVGASPASADPGGIVITEINYKSPVATGGDDNGDFVELTNTGTVPIDIAGWTMFGVTLTFTGPNTVIQPNDRIVAAKSATQFTANYGFAPNFVYSANLSNSGEQVSVLNGTTTVDTVTYTDTTPWPGTAKGGGPTLELRDAMSDNTDANNWGPSLQNGGTPGKVNSLEGANAPQVLTQVTANPARPSANQAVQISAKAPAGSTVTLKYKIMFNAEQSVTMLDNAASPGGANDGVYAANIPGQAAGSLIRYRVEATRNGVNFANPEVGETIHYLGTVVTDPSVSSQIPIVEWFMDDADYDDALLNHREDDKDFPAVWTYNGQVFDNTLMHIRGGISRDADEVQWKVTLPTGYQWDFGGRLPYPLDEFALQNYNRLNPDIAWETVKAAGGKDLFMTPVRTQRNGDFWNLGRIMETEDGEWRDAHNVKDWSIYKGDSGGLQRTTSEAQLRSNNWLTKKNGDPNDFSDVWQLSQQVDAPASAAQKTWILQNVNVPEVINYMALTSLMRHFDSGSHNWMVARDTNGTGRWELWHWDIDKTYGFTTSADTTNWVEPDQGNRLVRAMLGYPDFKQMFYRRLRTLADQFVKDDHLVTRWDQLAAPLQQDWTLDNQAWSGSPSPSSARNTFVNGVAERRTTINGSSSVPSSQSATASVVINELMYKDANGAGDWIELVNNSSTAVDLTGWTIPGVNLTIQAGTVIPAGARMVFVEKDAAFRAAYAGTDRLIGGTFSGGLSASGEDVQLLDNGRLVDQVTYDEVAPWPTAANGQGPSLELVSPTADNSNPANWRATTDGGTPGLANLTGAGTDNDLPEASFTVQTNGLKVTVDGSDSTDTEGPIASYSWNWGDGTAATSGRTATHTYTTNGTYKITLTVTDSRGAPDDSDQTVSVAKNVISPTAAFTSSTNGLLATFDGRGSSDSDGTVVSYSWDWDDDTANGTGAQPTHRYAAAGTYSVKLTVTDDDGATNEVTNDVTVTAPANASPTAAFTSTTNGLAANVDGTGSTDSDGSVATYAWSWGDGATTAASATTTASHTYGTAGTYPVTLTVTDDDGATNTISHDVTVAGPPPVNQAPTASFTVTASGLTAAVNGSGSSDSDGNIASYAWQFGDGATGNTGPSTSHAYDTAGTYTVTLTVTDDKGATNSTTRSVTVSTGTTTGSTLATDAFGRTSTNTFGSADTGGAWTVSGTAANYDVNNGTGKFTHAVGTTREAYLNAVSTNSADLRFSAAFTRPTSGSVYVGAYGRRVGSDNYRVRAVVSSSGSVSLQLQHGGTTLRSGTVAGVNYATGDTLQFRVQVTGTSPTTIQAKVWEGATEPSAWSLTTTDNTAALQAAGSVGLYSYYSSGSAPASLVVNWDNLNVATVGGGTPPTNAAPTASFTVTPNGLVANTNTSGSSDSDGTIATYAWNWGDSQTSTGANASHTYAAAGTYTVTLTVTDNQGATNTTTRSVTVTAGQPGNVAPTASFTVTPTGLVANTNSSASADSDGTISTYTWNWGDNLTSTGANASHTYAAAGTYTVRLTVTDNGGLTGTTTRTVTVTSGTPGTNFAADAFGRTSTNTFGSADTGGAWTVNGTAANYDVTAGTGQFTNAVGTTREAYLNGVSSNSTDLRFSAAFTRPTSGSVYVGAYGRRVGTDNYRVRAVVSSSGSVQLQLQHGATTLRSGTVAGLTFATGDTLQFRIQVTGTSPTTIQAKVWKGATEPTAWSLTTTDNTAALQAAGSIGLYAYYSSGSAPASLVVRFDNLTATRVQ